MRLGLRWLEYKLPLLLGPDLVGKGQLDDATSTTHPSNIEVDDIFNGTWNISFH